MLTQPVVTVAAAWEIGSNVATIDITSETFAFVKFMMALS
jgi:hypothetical protein